MSHPAVCRSCGSHSLESIVTWKRPTATTARSGGALATPVENDELFVCGECSLVQRGVGGHAEEPPRPGSSAADASWAARQMARAVIAAQKLRPTSLVVQVGSRDGRLLSDYLAADIPVLGIEPAVRLAERARLDYNVPTLCQHFDMRLAAELVTCGQPADVVHLRHVLPLVAELNQVVGGVEILLRMSGVAVVEVPYVKHLIDRGVLWADQQGARAHFSLTSLNYLFSRHGLVLHDAELAGEGSTLQVFAGLRGETSARVESLLAAEQAWGVNRLATYLPSRPAKVA